MRTNPGFELKIARLRYGIRQIEVARRLGIDRTRLSMIENGWTSAPPDLVNAIQSAIAEIARTDLGDVNAVV